MMRLSGLDASGVVLAHNHPSGDATPSSQDERLTRVMQRAGATLGIRIVDHLIVTRDKVTSMREAGLLFDVGVSAEPTGAAC